MDILIGVVSGVLTSAILFILFSFKKQYFDPWLENRLYKGVVLDGKWVGKKIDHLKPESGKNLIHCELDIEMDLIQHGYNIKGLFIARSIIQGTKDEDDNYSNIYKIRGHIQDNYVVLEYYPLSRRRTGMGTFIMEVKEGGKMLKGNITFLEEGEMEIVTLEKAILNRIAKE